MAIEESDTCKACNSKAESVRRFMADKIQIRKGSVGEPLIVPLYGRADNGTCRIYNLDFSDVIKCRNEIIPAGE